MSVIMSLIGGLGFFLYGMKMMSEGLQKVAGSKMRSILEVFTKNRVIGVLVGTFFTALIQSSNATTVMVVSFVNSGLMKLAQTPGIILGANIGTTVTGQLISFKLDAIAPFFIIAGVILVMFIKKPMARRIGEVVLGFCILFFGMSTLSSSVKHLNEFQAVKTLFGSITNPFLAVLVGFVLTSILQSASASVGILIVLASSGLIHPDICYYIIMGCDIGACGSAVLSSLAGNKDAKRAALIHLLFNLIGTVIIMILLAIAGDAIRAAIHGLTASIADTSLRAGRDVANINSILKVSQVILLFPFSKYLIKLTRLIVRGCLLYTSPSPRD